MMRPLLLLLCSACALTGCGYHLQDTPRLSMSIPYVCGDEEGKLTDALVKQVARSCEFVYAPNRTGTLVLEGEIIKDTREYIGFQFDRRPVSGERVNRLVPNEERREVTVRLTLFDARTGKIIYGPFDVKESSDYDFVDPDSLRDVSFIDRRGRRQSSLFFSLGQLDSREGAGQVALDPLYKKLAYVVVEGLENIEFEKCHGYSPEYD